MTKTKRKFRRGQIVAYEATTGEMLGPFTVGIYENGEPGLWYLRPGRQKLSPNDIGDHVHGILDSQIITIGGYEIGIDKRRIRPLTKKQAELLRAAVALRGVRCGFRVL